MVMSLMPMVLQMGQMAITKKRRGRGALENHAVERASWIPQVMRDIYYYHVLSYYHNCYIMIIIIITIIIVKMPWSL